MSRPITLWIASLAAIGELINDKLPRTPSRRAPPQFAARILIGSATGTAIGIVGGMIALGLMLGALGAIAGTLTGAWARRRLTMAIGGRDLPIALFEDAIAVGLSLWLLYGFGINDPVVENLLLPLQPALTNPSHAHPLFLYYVALALSAHMAHAYGG